MKKELTHELFDNRSSTAKIEDEAGDDACALCSQHLTTHGIRDGIHKFCCMGCHAVFNVLTIKNQIEGYEQHPLFIQALRSGLISNPALLEHIQRQKIEALEGEREKLYIEIGNMWCPSCAEIIRLMLLKEKGVLNCTVDYSTDLASIEFSPRYLSKDQLLEVINHLGYHPLPFDVTGRRAVSSSLYLRFIIASFCSLNIMMLAYPLYATYFNYDGEGYGLLFAWLSLMASMPVVLYSAWPIWKKFFLGLKTGFFGMETLVAIGVGAAFIFSLHELLVGRTLVYFDSMSIIIVFVLLGKIIEAKAKFSAKGALTRLIRATPRRGRKLFENNELRFVLIKEIAKYDLLVAYQGEKIVLDGIVVDGWGACDESLMTGEATPVVKDIGDTVLAGVVLSQGTLTYKVTNTLEETALQKIIETVEKDIGHKTIYMRAADRIVFWFVPTIIIIALLTALFYWLFPIPSDTPSHQTALLRALAVLLISCPCAIGIAAPIVESCLLNSLAGLGAIVRNRGCLAYLGKETVIIFDKTGTVTEGRFIVRSGLESLNGRQRQALYSLTSRSTHPIACAIAMATVELPLVPITKMEEISGHGICGEIENVEYCLGSERFFHMQGIEIPALCINKSSNEILSHVYFAENKRYVAHLELGDQIRPEIKELLKLLKPTRLILLSGDAEGPVSAVAKTCGFTEWHSSCTPLEKREFIDSLKCQNEIVCMLGDGINDAPALTAAHIGISVVSASDMSIQVSDLLLTTDRLNIISKIRQLALKGQKIIRQNLFWAFFYNVIGIFLAIVGILSPIFAAFAMSISSLTVLFNARRLTHLK